MATTTPATPFIAWGLLSHIVWVSLVAGVGLVAVFSLGLAALSMARGEQRSAASRGAALVCAVFMGAVIVVALGWGLVLIVKKS
ncbi:MAG: hypothetical protein ABI298_08725 [Acidimicrobiales bacterium]